jgi:hypothetical protein
MTDPTALMDRLQRSGRDKCLLCGRRTSFMGVWVPTASTCGELGAPAGKSRLVAYALCRKCQRRPDTPRRVEETILDDVRRELEKPEAN